MVALVVDYSFVIANPLVGVEDVGWTVLKNTRAGVCPQ
jgi:hypothetical protein